MGAREGDLDVAHTVVVASVEEQIERFELIEGVGEADFVEVGFAVDDDLASAQSGIVAVELDSGFIPGVADLVGVPDVIAGVTVGQVFETELALFVGQNRVLGPAMETDRDIGERLAVEVDEGAGDIGYLLEDEVEAAHGVFGTGGLASDPSEGGGMNGGEGYGQTIDLVEAIIALLVGGGGALAEQGRIERHFGEAEVNLDAGDGLAAGQDMALDGPLSVEHEVVADELVTGEREAGDRAEAE